MWDGVKNAAARLAVRAMRPGDLVLIYHSGGESAIVGIAEVVSYPRPDPEDAKSAVVDLRFRAKLGRPVSLKEIKASGRFADLALVRQGRLSTMAVPEEFVRWLREEWGATIP